ncbi:unnamed protein product [Parnassius apollo]|uniref:(apollo) hypothetical protein n=1 Tax=Parnassius apollo TaxID=110799 RepID=A0A8S3WS35_PARAO|nr:unnamed protein product [Parnassius apollo]
MLDEECNVLRCERSSKKRKTCGRISEVNKKLNLRSHEEGENCYCKRYKCFQVVNLEQRNNILRDFNLLPTRDAQNLYLCGLSVIDVPICFKALMAIHGITQQRLKTLKKSLQETGHAPLDRRCKHSNRPRKLTADIKKKAMEHVRLFRGRKSHYSLYESSKLYLSEDLNVKRMYNMFQYKDSLSYESYRTLFVNKFNIGFGYPRSDTCGNCDEFKAKLKGLEVDLKNAFNSEEKCVIEKKIRDLETENKVHKLKAEVFYRRKRATRIYCQSSSIREAIAMDYQKNLSMPNITSNETYYKRQLTVNLFNIHVLASSDSYFFATMRPLLKKEQMKCPTSLYLYRTQYEYQRVNNIL